MAAADRLAVLRGASSLNLSYRSDSILIRHLCRALWFLACLIHAVLVAHRPQRGVRLCASWEHQVPYASPAAPGRLAALCSCAHASPEGVQGLGLPWLHECLRRRQITSTCARRAGERWHAAGDPTLKPTPGTGSGDLFREVRLLASANGECRDQVLEN